MTPETNPEDGTGTRPSVRRHNGMGSVVIKDDGSARIIRSLPGFGVFVHLELTPDEVDAIRRSEP